MKDPVVKLFLLVAFAIAIVYALAFSCATITRAEWVKIEEFHGTQTDAASSSVGLDVARKSTGWLYRSGDMERQAWVRRFPSGSVSSEAKPIDFIYDHPNRDRISFFDGRLISHVHVTDSAASSVSLNSPVLDTASTFQADSSFHRKDSLTGSSWIKLTLADIPSLKIGTGVQGPIYGFYNDYLGHFRTSPTFEVSNQQVFTTLLVSSDEGIPCTVIANDTMFVTDGTTMFYVTNDSVTALTFPTYAAMGDVDSVRSDGDSLFMFENLPDSLAFYSNNNMYYGSTDDYRQGFVVMFSVDTVPHGIPFWLDRVDTIGGQERWKLLADSNVTGEVTDHDFVGTHKDGRIADGASYVVHSLRGIGRRFLQYGAPGRWDYRGVKGPNRYAVFTPSATEQFFAGAYRKLTLSTKRDFDCRMISTQATRSFCYVVKETDTLRVYCFGPNLTPTYDVNSANISFYEYPKIGIANSGQKQWGYRIAVMHRQRVFWAGDITRPTTFAYSRQGDYDSTGGSETLEGRDPITGLSSFGQSLAFYRRHGIGILNGFATTDFYTIPTPAGVGAVNHHTIQRDPLSGSDFFVNERGLCRFDGTNVEIIPTNCTEIFSDSINWALERYFCAAIYDGRYWLVCAFGSGSSNNRVVAFDLETGDVTFPTSMQANAIFATHRQDEKEFLYIGRGDSNVVYRASTTDNRYETADWRSGWYDGGDETLQKRITQYKVRFNGAVNDTLYADFFTDYSETAKWIDTIAVSSAGIQSVYAGVKNNVLGKVLGVGFRSPDVTMRVIDAAFDVVPVGRIKKQ